jgi:hypothetical protein
MKPLTDLQVQFLEWYLTRYPATLYKNVIISTLYWGYVRDEKHREYLNDLRNTNDNLTQFRNRKNEFQ